MSDKKIAIIGYSGHGFVVSEAAMVMGLNLNYYVEFEKKEENPFDLEYLGFEGDLHFKGWKEDFDFILGIGDNQFRQKIAELLLSKKKGIVNVIHPSASIANKVEIGSGNFIARNVAINPLVKIGNFCILNTSCIIEHECTIADAVHIAPGAVLAGNVSVGERSFIGANTVVKQGVKIGSDVIIGAGSVVLKDVPNNVKIYGNPAKIHL